MSLFKKVDEKTKSQQLENKKTKKINIKFKQQRIFTSYNPWNAIFVMVVPTIISMLVFSTYQIFDKWIATQWGWGSIIEKYKDIIDISPSEALKIINIATTYAAFPASIAVAFSVLISIGTWLKFSIAYNRTNSDSKNSFIGDGFLISIIIAVIFTVGMYFLIPLIINFQITALDDSSYKVIKDIISKEAISFSRILTFGAILLFISNSCLNLLKNEGKVLVSIIIILLSCLINIMLDFIFVIPGNLGIVGTAYATIIAWFLIIVISVLFLYYSGVHLKFRLFALKVKKVLVLAILVTGIISLLESASQSLLILFTSKVVSILPASTDYPNNSVIPIYIQLYGGIMPWLILINAVMIGFVQGARNLVTYVYQTKNYYRVWQIIWRLMLLLFVLLTVWLVVVIIVGEYMMHAFGVDLDMASHFKRYIIIHFAFYPLASLHFISIILYQGINRSKIALLASLQKTIIMPGLCLLFGYLIANATGNGFYFYMMIGFIDLFAAFIYLPMLVYSFNKSWPDIKKIDHNDNKKSQFTSEKTENREVELLKVKQK